MNQVDRLFATAVGLLVAPHRPPPAHRPEPASAASLPEPANDATAYGVMVEPVTPAPGTWYWRVLNVHHLRPAENGGNHHLFLDAWTSPTGAEEGAPLQRAYGARFRVSWPGREEVVTVDKAPGEPGTNFPLWKWQVVSVEALGLPGHDLPSDRVVGISTAHPDEAPGNTLFHHSFHVTFYLTLAPGEPVHNSEVSGRVHNGAGHTIVLTRETREVGRQVIAGDDTYCFDGLAPGRYRGVIEGAPVQSGVLTLDGTNMVTSDLELPTSGRPFVHYVLFGPAEHPATWANLLLAQDFLLAFRPIFGFRQEEAAQAGQVTIIADLAGVNQQVEEGLASGGARVQRIAGGVEEVAAALKERVARNQPF